ncbi:SDR family oxidoreductase [Neomegalonema sp.]|uniref:SDR family oxidoreductase n=1 Tax=Neomegalonema sp. TaxID=2039713 RepID=UPI002623498E|nr:SDR family oxidoreductase [Neomegalonema sp.]MDD2868454.1 SDR family oxidoreductase [Neomegalonema sp.]
MTPGAALVTGAAKRLGRAMALDLAAQGWDVAVHHHGSDPAEVLAEIRAMGRKAVGLRADLLKEEEVRSLVPLAAEALGRPLTLLVNNASIFEFDTLASNTREVWDRHFESNLRAPYVLTQAFAAQAPEAEIRDGEPLARALVVNMADQRVWSLTPMFSSYTLAKAALWAFTQTAAQGLAPQIRVNAIGPGPTLANDRQTPEHFARQRAGLILERGADPGDICAALRYLVSARAVTGQMIAVDGGQHLGWRTPDIVGGRE